MSTLIERGTDYDLQNATLSVYETNCSCKNIKFHFNSFVITSMLKGHKTIRSTNFKLEFFPGTILIPQKEVMIDVSIPNASLHNPTKCLVLSIAPTFIKSYYNEVRTYTKNLIKPKKGSKDKTHFISNNKYMIDTFTKLYRIHLYDNSPERDFIEDLLLKQILLRLFQTDALHLMIDNFNSHIANDRIRKVTTYISQNLDKSMRVKELCAIANMGQTTFYNTFKNATHYSPNEYIHRERIKHAKLLIQKNVYPLKEIAYKCGFNSYEYFSASFKKLEKQKPSEFKNAYIKSE